MEKILLFACLASCLAFVGCETVTPESAAKAVKSADSSLSVREKKRQIRFCVNSECTDGLNAEAAAETLLGVREMLVEEGAFVTSSIKDAEVEVSCMCVCTDKTTRGSRVAIRGIVNVSVSRRAIDTSFGRKIPIEILATKKIEAKSDDCFSAAEAARSLAASCRPTLKQWIATAVKTIAEDVNSVEICVAGLTPKQLKEGFATRLVKEMSRIDGVYSCRVRPELQSDSSITIVVLYDRRQIPDGVANRMYAKGLLKTESH